MTVLGGPAAMALFASDAADTLADGLPGIVVGRRIDVPLPKTDPESGTPLPLLPCPWRTLLWMRGENAANVLRTVAGADALLMTGTEHVVRAGDGDVLVAMFARRQANLDAARFRRRWLDDHARFGLRIDCAGYRQFHAAPGAAFDGAGMVFFRDAAHMRASRAAPELARDATRDEMAFIDHGASMLAMFALRR